ncbi:MAG: hypothetical protein MJZ53_03090 [Paludibacteraceae bacterium]|nr:hypothetical protein [Paludibacteraceae bacterium]
MIHSIQNKSKNIIALTLYVLINSLFVYKYTMRICSYPLLTTFGYWIILTAGVSILHILLRHSKHILGLIWSLGFFSLIGGIIMQSSIDPYSLQVDRWSAIHNWIVTLFQGTYPYSAQTHLQGYGSPFPIWQILHIPFYGLGNVALSTFAICILWVILLVQTVSSRAALIGLAGLIMSPAFWYEVSVRSDIFANLLLVACICQWLIYKRVHLNDYICVLGLVTGLVLSTRLLAVIPIAVLYGYDFLRLNWRKQLVFIGIVCLTFVLTFLPFVLWEGSTLLFFQYSPFVLQTRQGTPLIFLIWAIIAISWILYFKPTGARIFFSTSILLFILVSFACAHQIWATSFMEIFTNSTFDLTYFSTILPFLIITLAESGSVIATNFSAIYTIKK